jgi:hypothetical protein
VLKVKALIVDEQFDAAVTAARAAAEAHRGNQAVHEVIPFLRGLVSVVMHQTAADVMLLIMCPSMWRVSHRLGILMSGLSASHLASLLWQALREAEKALKMSQRKDYYKILSLDRSANVRDIKRVLAQC